MLNQVFAKKHILWMKLLYASVIAKNGEEARMLDSFASIEFRHLKWLAENIIDVYRNFDYEGVKAGDKLPKVFDFDNDMPEICNDFNEFIDNIKDDLKVIASSYSGDFKYANRFRSDESYFLHRIEKNQNQTGFLAYDSCGRTAQDIAKKFNIELSEAEFIIKSLGDLLDKEYASVISFFYIIAHIENKGYAEMLGDLLEESLSHFKYYAILMSTLGILRLPKPVKKEEYMISSLVKFLDKNIDEEIEEVKNMSKIASKTGVDELKNLLRFIEEQEKHHISILEELRSKI